jgi:dihydrofolate synthase/folylpolyglutamate synthase
MSKTLLDEWLQRLETLHPCEIDLGLERVASVAEALQLLPLPQPVISVAGTNGKGSTVAVMEAVLLQTGCVSGACTSPHLLRFNERIRVAGVPVDDSEIVEAFEQIESARGETSLTYFEFSTLAALVVFRARNVEVILLEVGLGGRLDAVNIVDADVAVITSIDLDHQDWLGDSREKISLEKAGILRRERAAVIAETDPPLALREYIEALGCEALFSGIGYQLVDKGRSWSATLRLCNGEQRQLPTIAYGSVLADNICAGLQSLLLINRDFSDEQLLHALQALSPPGRRELQTFAGREYLFDVAHNTASLGKLLEYIDSKPCGGRSIAIFSVMADKDFRTMLGACSGRFDAWFTANQPKVPRALDAEVVAQCLHDQGEKMVSVSKNLRQAFRRAQGLMSEGDRLVVFGSFNTVAGTLPLLEKDRSKGHIATHE